MKNKNIYYTPSLAEFNDGFLFEKKIKNNWEKVEFILKDLQEELQNIRVKKLNQDDIIECGFTKKSDVEFLKLNPSMLINKTIKLLYNSKYCMITIQMNNKTIF